MRIATSSIIDDRDGLITGIRTIRFNPSCPAYSGYSYNIDVNSIIELKCDDATGEKTVVYDTKYEPLYSGRGSKLIHDIEIDVDIDNWVDMTLKKLTARITWFTLAIIVAEVIAIVEVFIHPQDYNIISLITVCCILFGLLYGVAISVMGSIRMLTKKLTTDALETIYNNKIPLIRVNLPIRMAAFNKVHNNSYIRIRGNRAYMLNNEDMINLGDVRIIRSRNYRYEKVKVNDRRVKIL